MGVEPSLYFMPVNLAHLIRPNGPIFEMDNLAVLKPIIDGYISKRFGPSMLCCLIDDDRTFALNVYRNAPFGALKGVSVGVLYAVNLIFN